MHQEPIIARQTDRFDGYAPGEDQEPAIDRRIDCSNVAGVDDNELQSSADRGCDALVHAR